MERRARTPARRPRRPSAAFAPLLVLCLAVGWTLSQQEVEERLRRAKEYLEGGRLDRADREMEHAAEDAPRNADVQRMVCEIRRIQGRREEAVASCRRAAGLEPARADLHLDLGDLLVQREDGIEEAIRAYRRAAEIEPNNARPHVNLGGVFERLGRMHEAEAEYREALALNPNLVQANAGLGAVLFAAGRLPDARVFLSRAIELRPRDLRSHI